MNSVESLFQLVKRVLDEEDIEGLLSTGCPADEYEEETRLIVDQIRTATEFGHKELNVALAESVVAKVCTSQFGPFTQEGLAQRMESYGRVARKIVGAEPGLQK